MVGIAAFGPGDLGSSPDWFAVSKSNRKFSQIIQACSTLASTVTLLSGASLYVSIIRYLSCKIDGLVHQYEEVWSGSTWQDQSHCSIGILESSRLVL